jgi:hypothetical protein
MSTENSIPKKKKSIYVAGPMSGYPEFNFPKFFAVQHEYEAKGWIVYNPANKSNEAEVVKHSSFGEGDDKALMKSGWSFRDAYTWDVTRVIEADAIYMLKGWEASPGARGEHAVAMAMKSKHSEYEIIYEQ